MAEKEKRILVGMSGGIDSSSVCIMLQEQGYEVVGVTMRTWDIPSHFSVPGQEQPDDVLEAQALAARLGIEHHVADVRKEFKDVIVRYFIDEYMRGRTPNPCVMCNPLFKERILCEWADRTGCAWIATGHYCRLDPSGRVTSRQPTKAIPRNPKRYQRMNPSVYVCALCAIGSGYVLHPQ